MFVAPLVRRNRHSGIGAGMRLSKNMRRLLLLAADGAVLQSTALARIYRIPAQGRVRPRPGKYFSAQAVGVNRYNTARTSLTRSLRRLERAGLVVRHRARSAGGACYELTELGREVAQGLLASESEGGRDSLSPSYPARTTHQRTSFARRALRRAQTRPPE